MSQEVAAILCLGALPLALLIVWAWFFASWIDKRLR